MKNHYKSKPNSQSNQRNNKNKQLNSNHKEIILDSSNLSINILNKFIFNSLISSHSKS